MNSKATCWNCKFHAKYDNAWEGICVNPKSENFLGYSKNYHDVGLGKSRTDYPCFSSGKEIIRTEEMYDYFENFVKEAGYLEDFKKYLLGVKGLNEKFVFREE